ncbi:MAG: 50S ribosomal protein L34e [Candidatus Woesearchaeota archaeon]
MQPSKTKSRTFRRVQVRLPTGTVTHYDKRKPAQARCGQCQKVLHGIPRGRPYQIAKLAKTERRPERPYGGVLCSACARKKILAEHISS